MQAVVPIPGAFPHYPVNPSCLIAATEALKEAPVLGDSTDPRTVEIAYTDSAVAKVFGTYQHTCFTGENGLPAGLAKAGYEKWTGELVQTSSMQPFCTAFLIRSDVIITARHCFFSPDDGSPQPGTNRGNGIAFVPFDHGVGRRNLVPIAESSSGGFPFTSDHILVRLQGSASAAAIPEFASPALGAVVLAGVFTWTPQRLVQVSGGGSCQIIELFSGCFVHACQTTPGFSGAPIVQSTAAGYRVVGMHLGDTRNGDCQGADRGTANFGLTLTTSMFSE